MTSRSFTENRASTSLIPASLGHVRHVNVESPATSVVHFAERVVETATEIYHGGLRVLIQVLSYLAHEVVVTLCHLQCAEKTRGGLHLLSSGLKIVIQAGTDPFSFTVLQKLRKPLRTDLPAEKRNYQRFLDCIVLYVHFHLHSP